MKLNPNAITINGQEIKAEMRVFPQADIRFYPENPRIYSQLSKSNQEASQEEIEEKMIKLDHVYRLAQSIKTNIGVLNPLLVRKNDMTVLEGNSRLAAYRLLAKRDPISWGNVKCRLLVEKITEEQIFNLLGMQHMIGVQGWSRFEQAAYLWRRVNQDGKKPSDIASELGGLSEKHINHHVAVYSFMIKHNDLTPHNWSYYDVYLRSVDINKKRKHIPGLDSSVVKKIANLEITRAADIRDKLKAICKVDGPEGNQLITKFINNKNSLQDCFAIAKAKGEINVLFDTIQSFRENISIFKTRQKTKNIPSSRQKEFIWELTNVRESVDKFIALIKSNP